MLDPQVSSLCFPNILYTPCDGEFLFVSTWLEYGAVVWSDTSLDVTVKEFVDVVNIYDQLTLSKADFHL